MFSHFSDLVFARIINQISLIPSESSNPELAQRFIDGQFTWNDILAYGLYLIQLLLTLAGGFLVVGMILAGYSYMIGSVVEDKEQGKNSVKHNLIGFAIVVLSWAIVDIVITLLIT